MQDISNALNKDKLNFGEILLMVILTPLVFCVAFAASGFISLFASGGTNSGVWLWGPIGLIMMISIFVCWVFLTKKIFEKRKKTKILFMTAGLAVITSFLILWIGEKLNLSHMFG